MRLLYDLVIWCYGKAIALAALAGDSKATLWIAGREAQKNIFDAPPAAEPHIWMHCASLGEFEQGRPVLEEIRAQFPEQKILLTFFSPSGYEVRHTTPLADTVLYLPPDSRGNARRLPERFNVSLAFFVKYEYWYHYLTTLGALNIPTLLVSGIFRERHWIFRPFFRPALEAFTHFFVQDEASQVLLTAHGFANHTLAGDTRFDRVAALAANPKTFPLIAAWAGKSKVVVAGSTWPADEELLAGYIRNTKDHVKFIIAPHETTPAHIGLLQGHFGDKAMLYSAMAGAPGDGNVLIIDSIGLLSSLYSLAHIAYVGGGFGAGVHNTLEAAVYGIPVLVGPKNEKFREIRELTAKGGMFMVGGATALTMRLDDLLNHEDKRHAAGEICRQYCEQSKGATARIMQHVQALIIKTAGDQ